MVLKGKFKMMQVYNALIEDSNKVNWYHMMQHNIARPRANVIMWLVSQDRLPTKTRLKRFGLLQLTNCELCDEDEETMTHLMFNCKGTISIWSKILNWLDINDNISTGSKGKPMGKTGKWDYLKPL
ncbi:uncharacterized protein LOC131631539 [Vicia villosa]|uniref:uncharacterized protein LOC131631539 n=1 Tax=Vicia villosa TaxID=3911 RepID=UPI00273CCE9B|nr:uncharacterized protein LOC131631539 [Vicia villosa]